MEWLMKAQNMGVRTTSADAIEAKEERVNELGDTLKKQRSDEVSSYHKLKVRNTEESVDSSCNLATVDGSDSPQNRSYNGNQRLYHRELDSQSIAKILAPDLFLNKDLPEEKPIKPSLNSCNVNRALKWINF